METMRIKPRAFCLLGAGMLTAAAAQAGDEIIQASPANPPPVANAGTFDATRLKAGRFTYQDIQDGKQGSLSTCTISRRADGLYLFTCDFPAFEQN
jgi:hypothetical protein